MSKPKLTIDSKHTVLDVNQITLTVEQLSVAMNNVYESSYTRVAEFRWYDSYSVAFSISATLFITCLTSDFKDFSSVIAWLHSDRMAFLAWLIVFLSFVFGMLCVCRKAHKNDNVFVDRNNTVICEINKLKSKNKEDA